MEDFNNGGGFIIEWLYENDSELFTLICINDYLTAHYPTASRELLVPYLPHARMDRVKNRKDVFTLKSFCNVINGMNFDNVIVRDVHSNVSLALLNNVVLQEPTYYIEEAKEKCGAPVLFYPDEGAIKRYSSLIKAPFSFGIKDRDWDTGIIKGLNIMNPDEVKGKDVLIRSSRQPCELHDICGHNHAQFTDEFNEALRVDRLVPDHKRTEIQEFPVVQQVGHGPFTARIPVQSLVSEN